MDCCSLTSGLEKVKYFLVKQMGLRNTDFDSKDQGEQKHWQFHIYHLGKKRHWNKYVVLKKKRIFLVKSWIGCLFSTHELEESHILERKALQSFVHRRGVATVAAGSQEELRAAISLVCTDGTSPLQRAPRCPSGMCRGLVRHQNPAEWAHLISVSTQTDS